VRRPVHNSYHDPDMSIGPVLDCPKELREQFATVLQPIGIAVADLPNGVQFRSTVARVEGKTRFSKDRCLVWLTLPQSHAFNPLLWCFDFALCKRVRLALRRHGATDAEWEAFGKLNSV
jgi:hypothetical protein